MKVARQTAAWRTGYLGWHVLDRLADALDGANRVALVSSPSLRPEHLGALERGAGRSLGRVIHPPASLTAAAVDALRDTIDGDVDAVVGVGGGRIMDASKALTRPGDHRLVLVPTTLSGSEHTANTSWWDGDEKVVSRVGMADAVCADPALLVDRLDVLIPGALHAVAHVLATLAPDATASPVPGSIAALALPDLVAALHGEVLDDGARLRFMRGAWNAAVGFALTGPRIGAHHAIVHRAAAPGEHATFSARLLCAVLARSDVYADTLGWLCERSPDGVVDDLLTVARRWDARWSDDGPLRVPLDPDSLPAGAMAMVAVAADAGPQ